MTFELQASDMDRTADIAAPSSVEDTPMKTQTNATVKPLKEPRAMRQKEIVRFWSKYLKLSNRARWNPQVEEDFKELVDTDISFDDWWDGGERELFENMDTFIEEGNFDSRVLVDHVTNRSDIHGEVMDDDLLIRVSVYPNSMQATVNAFKALLLSTQRYGRRGRPAGPQETWGRYYLEKTPEKDTLQKILDVYNAKQANPTLTHYQLAIDLNLVPHDEDHVIQPNDSAASKRGKTMITNAIVSRYLRYANSILDGVCEGRFPVYSR